jgi:hypothetical protein
MDHERGLDARVAVVAARQLSLVTGAQARTVGLTRNHIQHRLDTGRWRKIMRNLYAIGGAPRSWQRDALAPCLVGPPGAVASFTTAAALWALTDPSRVPHVTVAPTSSTRMPIATVHRALLAPIDVTHVGVIPVTRVPRTLVDLATVASTTALEHALDTALNRRLATPRDLLAAIDRSQQAPGRPGVQALVAALGPWIDPIRPGSEAEARLLRRLQQWKLPDPDRQYVVRDTDGGFVGRIDVAWPRSMVGLEYDSARFHDPRHFEQDEHRHDALEDLGWTLVHTDRLDLRPGDHRLLDELRPLLQRPAA